MDVTFCAITPAHARLLAEIHAAVFGANAWSVTAIMDLIDSHQALGCLALVADGPVGFILWRFVADEGEILTLAVLEAYRRQGIARAFLLDGLLPAGVANGILRIFLEVAVNNHAALCLYEGIGFARVGRRKSYYPDGSDALIFAWSIACV